MSSRQASIPIRAAGLWSGANTLHASISFNTSSVIMQDFVNFSPPCTTLCPTALISSKDVITPFSLSVSCSSTMPMAVLWSGMAGVVLILSFPAGSWVRAPSIPILSQRPFASTSSVSESISWYLREELPQLITKTFIFILLYILIF